MNIEIEAAVELILSLLAEAKPDQIISFGVKAQIRKALTEKLKERSLRSWHPSEPLRGSSYRCILLSPANIDPLLKSALYKFHMMDRLEVLSCRNLILWIDPGEVTIREGDRGQPVVIWDKDVVEAVDVVKKTKEKQKFHSIVPQNVVDPIALEYIYVRK